jgi:hypothetical protein
MLYHRRLAAGVIITAIAIAAAACGSSATQAPTSAPTPAAVTPAPETPAPATPAPVATSAPEETTAPEETAGAGESLALPSLDLGSFLQHQNPDLEAKLPDTLNGATLVKASYKGLSSIAGSGGSDPFAGALGSLGANAENLTFAVAFDMTGGSEAGYLAYQIPGMDAKGFLDLMTSAVGQGDPTTKIGTANVGGKNVTTATGSSGTVYLYANGDVLYGVFAPDETQAAAALQALP